MKSKSFFFVSLCCLLCTSRVQAQMGDSDSPLSGFPPYETVLDSLLERYDPDLPGEDYLAVSRRPDGYYVGVNRRGDAFPAEARPYWLSGEQGPRALPYRERQSPFAHYSTENVGVLRIPQFERHLYYGYPEFTRASIEVLEAISSPSVQQRAWLARAHEEQAMNLLNNQYGTSAAAYRFPLDDARQEPLNEEQLAIYLEHVDRATALYAALPDTVQTPVGAPSVKATHQYISAYLTLLQYHSRETALAAATKAPDGYDDHLLFCGRLLLESCPSNAVLITEGDNDTYPLLYLQLREDFRTDVLVVNRHLLHQPRYVETLRWGEQIGGPLPFNSSPETVRSWAENLYLPGPRGIVNAPEEALRMLSELDRIPVTPQEPIARLPIGAIKLTPRTDGPVFRSEARVFGVGELATLDIVASSIGRRPLVIAVNVRQEYFAYSNSWQQIGLVYDLANERSSLGVDLAGTLAWSQLMTMRQPIATYGRQSRYLLDHLEELVVKCTFHLQRYREEGMALELIDRYLSHLDRREIFSRSSSFLLLKRMHELGYDPVVVTAYLGILREKLTAIPPEALSTAGRRTLGQISHYLSTGSFPTITPFRN